MKKSVYHIRLINHTLLALPDKLLNTDYQLPIAFCEYFKHLKEARKKYTSDWISLYFHDNCNF